ncbi:hypothetical protein MTR_8g076077 [Medicago truncatula]|uniref:Uncharacterized protein n=1 Tax=Medicago truncatula TaxID=3880 RepID=A0A072U3K9_MEDTR|nr:hypothetical protein MTR_8g076077 [Medicago truncatula]
METESRLKQYREWEHECKNCLSFCGCGMELVASFGMIFGETVQPGSGEVVVIHGVHWPMGTHP